MFVLISSLAFASETNERALPTKQPKIIDRQNINTVQVVTTQNGHRPYCDMEFQTCMYSNLMLIKNINDEYEIKTYDYNVFGQPLLTIYKNGEYYKTTPLAIWNGNEWVSTKNIGEVITNL